MRIPNPFNTNSKVLAIAASLLATASTALANNSVFLEVGGGWSESNPYQYYNGGEFTALTTAGVPAGYSSANQLQVTGATGFPGTVTGFETFCVEDQVDFYVGNDYTYTLGTAIQQGNSVGSLTAGVAWLYEQFATGALAGYDFTTATTGPDQAARIQDAGQLQALIWELEGEPCDPGDVYSFSPTLANEETNIYWSALSTQFHGNVNAINALVTSTNNSYGVDVMELRDSNGGDIQDQLIYSRVPDNGTSALLVGISLLVLAVLPKFIKQAKLS